MLSQILFGALISLFAIINAHEEERQEVDHEELRGIMHRKFLMYGYQCIPENPLTLDDVIAFKENRFPDGENAPCFMACVQRKLGILDDEGKYTYDELLEDTSQGLSEEEQENLTKYVKGCKKVNKVKVRDGDEGCERAKLIYNCLIKRAPMYGYDVDL